MNNYCLEVVERHSHLRQFEDDVQIGVIDCDEDYSAGDASKTTYDPNKYRDAEEAKNARRLRRGEC